MWFQKLSIPLPQKGVFLKPLTSLEIPVKLHTFIHLLKFLSLWEPPTPQEFPFLSEGNTQSRNTFSYVKKRQNGRQNSQEALHLPFPLQWGRFLWEGDGSFQVVWQTDLEIDLEWTQNYCVELVALYRSTGNDYLINTAFRSSGKQTWKSIWNEHKIIVWR